RDCRRLRLFIEIGIINFLIPWPIRTSLADSLARPISIATCRRPIRTCYFSNSNRNNWYSTMQTYRTTALAGYGTGPIPYGQFLDLYRTSYSGATPSE